MDAQKLGKAIQKLTERLSELRNWEAMGFIAKGYKLTQQKKAINQVAKSAEIRKYDALPQELTPYADAYLKECTEYNKQREKQASAPKAERAEQARQELNKLMERIQNIKNAENSGTLSKFKAYRLRVANCIASELDPWDLDPKGIEWEQFNKLMKEITEEKKRREN